jgi:hypothetical protein
VFRFEYEIVIFIRVEELDDLSAGVLRVETMLDLRGEVAAPAAEIVVAVDDGNLVLAGATFQLRNPFGHGNGVAEQLGRFGEVEVVDDVDEEQGGGGGHGSGPRGPRREAACGAPDGSRPRWGVKRRAAGEQEVGKRLATAQNLGGNVENRLVQRLGEILIPNSGSARLTELRRASGRDGGACVPTPLPRSFSWGRPDSALGRSLIGGPPGKLIGRPDRYLSRWKT